MSLEADNLSKFTSLENIAESLQFIATYQWVYDFQLTHFLLDKKWEHVPNDASDNVTVFIFLIIAVKCV